MALNIHPFPSHLTSDSSRSMASCSLSRARSSMDWVRSFTWTQSPPPTNQPTDGVNHSKR